MFGKNCLFTTRTFAGRRTQHFLSTLSERQARVFIPSWVLWWIILGILVNIKVLLSESLCFLSKGSIYHRDGQAQKVREDFTKVNALLGTIFRDSSEFLV
jgi:hypothetical protein